MTTFAPRFTALFFASWAGPRDERIVAPFGEVVAQAETAAWLDVLIGRTVSEAAIEDGMVRVIDRAPRSEWSAEAAMERAHEAALLAAEMASDDYLPF